MAVTLFKRTITDLNFSFIDGEGKSGVLLTADFVKINKRLSSPNVLFALETARQKFNADAVYFRYFEDGRSALPQLYLFDFTSKAFTNEQRYEIHRQMWNGYQVPAYVIIQKDSVTFYDSRQKPKEDLQNYASEIIKLTGNAIKEFSAQSFDDGLFWEEEAKNHFRFEQSATKDLIRGLKAVYKSFQERSGLNRHVTLKLLVQCLLIKYLEERDEDSHSGYFAGTYFRRNFQCENFCDTIRKGKLLDLLDQLAKDFNGKIFEWDQEDEREQRAAIKRSEVTELAEYLDGNIQNNQFVLWRLYSFSHLPVEVISSVYEELLTDSKDIVYTPEMIVSIMVDECMPLKQPQERFKLIDVSCGSGIFLVKAYKRLVQWWRFTNWQKTGELVKPSLSVLKDLLLKNIHGLDIEQDAVRLSVFSLSLAMLDEVNLDPPTWGKLKFPDLGNNILIHDFFHFITFTATNDYNLVIGNPPFNLPFVNGKEPDRKRYFKALEKEIGYATTIIIPDENPALHFLVQSMSLLQHSGLLCLIQPSGPLFYQKNKTFKHALFSQFNILQVLDFTKLADKLWGKTNVATAAVFLQKSIPDENAVLHLVANRNTCNTNRVFLEFDHYDFHFIDKQDAWEVPYVWKANLIGGGRVTQLIQKLTLLPTLKTFLRNKEKQNGWVFGEGFIKGKPDTEVKPKDIHNGKGGYRPVEYLDNSVCIDTKKFNEEGIGDTYIQKGIYYQWGRVQKLFEPPLLLIKKGIGKKNIPVYFSDQAITYRHRIYGVHAPDNERNQLIAICNYFLNYADIIRFYIIATSAEILINRATAIFTQDILNIPYIPDQTKKIISEADRLVLSDTLTYHLNIFENSLFEPVSIEALQLFIVTFCRTLNTVYRSTERSFSAFKILDANGYYGVHFEFDLKQHNPAVESVRDLERYIEQAIPNSIPSRRPVHIRKIIKIYGKDTLILVKPKQVRYWLPSIAFRDADETFADYINSRYYAER